MMLVRRQNRPIVSAFFGLRFLRQKPPKKRVCPSPSLRHLVEKVLLQRCLVECRQLVQDDSKSSSKGVNNSWQSRLLHQNTGGNKLLLHWQYCIPTPPPRHSWQPVERMASHLGMFWNNAHNFFQGFQLCSFSSWAELYAHHLHRVSHTAAYCYCS